MNNDGIELIADLREYIKELEEKNKALVNRVINLENQLCFRRSPRTPHQLNNIKNH